MEGLRFIAIIIVLANFSVNIVVITALYFGFLDVDLCLCNSFIDILF